jgi:exosortase D (VPLPA-CTERM-specific)
MPLAYLLFMVPLPNFLYNNLSQALQLVSSAIGVEFIRLFGISVHLEGNVIDLGGYRLQVVEACSGLRYLFPLMSFGVLVAYLFQAPMWQRVLVFLATVPITVLMNSFRIGVIGVLVEHQGIGAAEGFLHAFEGWIIFISCLAVLLGVIWLLHRLSGATGSVWDRLDLSLPQTVTPRLNASSDWRAHAPLLSCVALLAVFAVGTQRLDARSEALPARDPFLQFPLLHEGWLGREQPLDAPVVQTLGVSDYLMANYRKPDRPLPVNLYVAFYDSQRKGTSAHSPRSCIPGGGWVISDLAQVAVRSPGMTRIGGELRVNRVIIQRGEERQLVYYWFLQRGRALTNEYLVKWLIFWDSLTRNRTDGALVRMVVPVPEGMDLPAAETQLEEFLHDFHGLLNRYVPD